MSVLLKNIKLIGRGAPTLFGPGSNLNTPASSIPHPSPSNESVSDVGESVGDVLGGDISGDTGNEDSNSQQYAAEREALLNGIKDVPDSNISKNKNFINLSDPWNKAASLKEHEDYWKLKEEIFLYTFHDKQKHRYLSSISIDCSKNDIMGTCQINFPYHQELMEYWIPGKTTFSIIGGTYDREVLFTGRVSEINQRGEIIELVGQDIGWKFKAYMTSKFEKSLEGMKVKDAVKVIFKKLGITNGQYYIDLKGIPEIDDFIIGENLTIEKSGETVQNIPELEEVIKRLNSYKISDSTIDNYRTRTIEQVSEAYDRQSKNHLTQVRESKKMYGFSVSRQNYGISSSLDFKEDNNNISYNPILEKIQGKDKLEDYIIKGYSGDGENTYEDILLSIAQAVDAHFFIVDTTVYFLSFNALLNPMYKINKGNIPSIDFWKLQDSSYELDISQYGYYNTVKIKYKNGTITKSYEDLVKVFGEIPITYDEPNLDYAGAMLKAEAYLIAHVRDFGMEIKATVLHSGDLFPSSFVKLKNPLTMSEVLFFIHGISVQWSADEQTLICDLDLRYGPENPDGLEVPEAGTQYSDSGGSTGTNVKNVSANISQAAAQITAGCSTLDQKALAIYNWVDANVRYSFYYGSRYSSSQMLQGKQGNCWDTAYLIYDLCSAAGVKCEVYNGTYRFLNGTYGHLWNKIEYGGKMVFADTGYGSTGSIKRNPIGSYHGGSILSQSCVAKNY